MIEALLFAIGLWLAIPAGVFLGLRYFQRWLERRAQPRVVVFDQSTNGHIPDCDLVGEDIERGGRP